MYPAFVPVIAVIKKHRLGDPHVPEVARESRPQSVPDLSSDFYREHLTFAMSRNTCDHIALES